MMSTVLMYHSIDDGKHSSPSEAVYAISPERFREQMGMVRDQGKWGQVPSGSVPILPVITFDDGLEDNYTNALPILKEFGIKAYFFITVSRIGTKGFMNWEQVKELKDAGMIIGSHGMTHGFMTKLSPTELEYEFGESKRILEEKLGQRVDLFAIPRGFHNRRVLAQAKASGYTKVFTSNVTERNPYLVGRIAVRRSWSSDTFRRILQGKIPLKERARHVCAPMAKRVLGPHLYDAWRARAIQ